MGVINIKPDREYLHEVLTKIKDGKYAIPSFQRNYVWRKDQALDLFDSLSKGYPIGSILLWQPDSNDYIETRNILTDELDETNDVEYFVLDGRQRLTTFYGCMKVPNEQNVPQFNIGYNLEKNQYEFINKSLMHVVPVYVLFNTFELLEWMDKIRKALPNDEERTRQYINSARKINAMMQAYQIGEVQIKNCNLDEASTVFSRINSKGTDISKVQMLQAVFFKAGNKVLLADRIEQIRSSLGKYHFQTLKQEDILNCCYKYIDVNFYDVDKTKDWEKLDFTAHLDTIEIDLIRTAEFLHDECFVLSSRILPYTKQFITIAGFFKEVNKPTREQLDELKRWFYYTTICQSFMNGSLSNVRNIIRRFDEFVHGEKCRAEDYLRIDDKKINFDFKFSHSSALSNFLLISLIYNYKRYNSDCPLTYNGEFKLFADVPEGVFPYLTDDDRWKLQDLLRGDGLSMWDLAEYALDRNVLFTKNDKNRFREQRGKILASIEKELLTSVGLKVEKSTDDIKGQDVLTNIEDFVDNCVDLNYNEIYDLYQAFEGEENCCSVFMVTPARDTQNGYIVKDPATGTQLLVNPEYAHYAKKWIEDNLMDGLDPESYWGLNHAMEKDD